ncbi:zinc ribbon domain-containing protein [Salinigranum marinum]|uniref:zinc ribbon domain-containing protein n=1 Tax=Salinigranum marinum TaxID=1515595 RepID=UPI002989A929|nr:zinc ribbon domain-containing protein [Salinigranum marinum]
MSPPSDHRGDESGCPKCGHTGTEIDDIATSGTGLSKMFDIQNRTFTVVTCTNCGYSELYRGQSSGDLVDLFLG